jgi:hypothetical protein
MNTFKFPLDINIVSFLTIKECVDIKCLSKDSTKYVYYQVSNLKHNASNVIKRFLKKTHYLFETSKKIDGDIIISYLFKNKNSLLYKRLKFISVNLLYMNEYNVNDANSFIQGLNVEYKQSLIQKYITVDIQKTYSKYDLHKILTKMNVNDIFYIGF